MFRLIKTLAAVAVTTALEGLQQPVCLLLAFTGIELTVLQPLVQLHAFGESGRLTRDSGLAFMLVTGMLIATFTSGFTLSNEIKSGTVATALSKPVSRPLFLFGKFLGAMLVVIVFCWCDTFAVLFAERSAEHYVETATQVGQVRDVTCGILAMAAPVLALGKAAFVNWRFRFRFGLWFFITLSVIQPLLLGLLGFLTRNGSWAGWANYHLEMDFRIVTTAALVVMLLGIFSALATAMSTRLQTGAAVAGSFAILFIGFLADSQLGGRQGILPKLLYSLVPDVQHFWLADSLADGGVIPLRYLMQAGTYALTYIAFVLMLGAVSFDKRDLG